MPIVEWSDKYKTGFPDIDREHRSLFALINDLYDKVEAGSAESSVKHAIEEMVDYVNYHFAREESLMAVCRFPDIENHKAQHRKLKSQVEDYKKSYERHPQSFDMADFIGFLTHWLQDHILQSDMAYVPDVQRRVDSIVGHQSD